MFQFLVTNKEEEQLLLSINDKYKLKPSDDVEIISEVDDYKIKRSDDDIEDSHNYYFFLPSYNPNALLYEGLKEGWVEGLFFEDNSVRREICISGLKDSDKYLNAIRGKSPELSFQFIYFFANKFPQDFKSFLEAVEQRHRADSIGMLNHNFFTVPNESSLSGLNLFISQLEKKKIPYFILLSSNSDSIKSKINSKKTLFFHRDGKEAYINIVYYKKVNLSLYRKLLEMDIQEEMRLHSEEMNIKWENFLDEIEGPDYDENFGPLGEMSDEVFKAYLEKINGDPIYKSDDTESNYW